jgi:peptide deformylase
MTELHFDLTLYPDPLLRRPAAPVGGFDEELRAIVAGMFERMYASKGVGLAAPQVGLKKRILVLNPTGSPEDEHVLVNPRILERSGPLTLFEEGCLSFPGSTPRSSARNSAASRPSDPTGRASRRPSAGSRAA